MEESGRGERHYFPNGPTFCYAINEKTARSFLRLPAPDGISAFFPGAGDIAGPGESALGTLSSRHMRAPTLTAARHRAGLRVTSYV